MVMPMKGFYGFRHAPVTKALVVLLPSASFLVHNFHLTDTLVFPHVSPWLTPRLELWRLVTHLLFFSSMSEALLAAGLLFNYRCLERRIGSSAFAAFSVVALAAGVALRVAAQTFLETTCAPGPHPLLAAILVFSWRLLPSRVLLSAFGLSLGDITCFLLIAAQFVVAGLVSWQHAWLPCACGAVIGWLFGTDLLGIRALRLPRVIESTAVMAAKAVGMAGAPKTMVELFAGPRAAVPPPPANAPRTLTAAQVANLRDMQRAQMQQMQQMQQAAQTVQVSEENIAELEAMGFSRQQATAALQRAGNSLQHATAVLLGD